MKKRPANSFYRKIYENHHGPIPKDEFGRSYDIHHIDGNPHNNSIDNLIALSVADHYELHKNKGDYQAAAYLATRLKLDISEIKLLLSKAQLDRVRNKSHHLLNKGSKHPKYDSRVYKWQNIKTNEIISLTQYDFCQLYNFAPQPINNILRSKRKSYKNWRLYSCESYTNNNYDHTVYTWKNLKTNEILHMTQSDFKKYNGFCTQTSHVSALIKGKIHSYKKWTVENL